MHTRTRICRDMRVDVDTRLGFVTHVNQGLCTHTDTYTHILFNSRHGQQSPSDHAYALPSKLECIYGSTEPKLEGTPLPHPTYDAGKQGICLQDLGTSEGSRLSGTNCGTV